MGKEKRNWVLLEEFYIGRVYVDLFVLNNGWVIIVIYEIMVFYLLMEYGEGLGDREEDL